MVERKKFGTLGWNVKYNFNDSDFSVSENLMAIYIDESEDTPWAALKYLIAECNYGGRVTDSLDRRLLSVYINQFFSDATFAPKFQLSTLDTYSVCLVVYLFINQLMLVGVLQIPEDGPLESYIKYISALPKADQDAPEAFGQHPNADIASLMDETRTLLGTVLSLQPRVVASGGKGREDVVLETVAQLLEQIPVELDLPTLQKKYYLDKSPLTTVLLQEISRYNALLRTVHQSLDDLKKVRVLSCFLRLLTCE